MLRLGAAIGLGVAAALLFPLPLPTRIIVGWNVLALAYLIFLWTSYLRAGSLDTWARGPAESRTGIASLLIAASIASLVAIGFMISAGPYLLHVGLAGTTVLLSWMVVQATFALQYIRLYHSVDEGASEPVFRFENIDDKPSMLDFLYLACGVGMTYNSSEVSMKSSRMRSIVLSHQLVSFFFNTVVLAMSIGVVTKIL